MGIKLMLYYLMVFLDFCISIIAVVFSYVKVSKAVANSEVKIIRRQVANAEQGRNLDNICYKRCFCWICACICSRGNKIAPSGTRVTDPNEIRTTTATASTSLHLSEKMSNTPKVPSTDNGVRNSHSCVALSVRTSIQTTSTSVDHANNHQASSSHGHQFYAQGRPRGIRRKSLRTTVISFIVCAVFVISWLPPWICFFIALNPPFIKIPTMARLMLFGKMTYLLNTVVNPLVYTLFSTRFRHHIKRLFKCS
ncbi:hypothetical protein DPMN_006985 [Dreissena polymorpha]|uniref:G-protein coupled receptors family 1 profile domain-containing protein n=1 Tax=Dreissena polymorpha TaxID=45954 RepID=A0A9D4RYA5_DREPO|nr:hypothetical protein DPMN_006985 [Dreissena polymorpha]